MTTINQPSAAELEASAFASEEEAIERAANARKSGLWRTFNHLLRRIHLYAGLLLLPWVLLYGVTGMLFNHATWFPDTRIVEFGPSAVAGTPLAELPTPETVAASVIAQINEQSGVAEYKLVKPELARFERGGIGASVKDAGGTTFNVTLDPKAKSGTAREARPGGPGGPGGGRGEKAPFAAREGVELAESPLPLVEKSLATVLENAGLEGVEVTEVRMAPLAFQMEGSGKLWNVTYNAQQGSLSGQAVEPDALPSLSARSFLLRLHVIHHYPSEFGFRWIWAVIVDVISLLMVFWAFSGIVMWWQIKRTRLLGAVLLVVSLVAATWLGMGMHEIFANTPGR